MQGYHKVDAVLKGCEEVGEELERAMSVFVGAADARKGGKGKEESGEVGGEGEKVVVVGEEKGEGEGEEKVDETAVDLVAVDLKDVEGLLEKEVDPERKKALKGYIKKQPELLAEGVVLKDYQVSAVVSSLFFDASSSSSSSSSVGS